MSEKQNDYDRTELERLLHNLVSAAVNEAASTQCGNVIFNCRQMPSSNDTSVPPSHWEKQRNQAIKELAAFLLAEREKRRGG